MIPILIISYNNYKYVDNTVKQLTKINPDLIHYIIIVDNLSNCVDTINYLKNVNVKVIWNKSNNGPWITPTQNSEIYNKLPDKFILTDPDLEFNENLPSNFIETLMFLSEKYNTYKIGFALDISDFDKMYDSIYFCGQNIYNWESKFWKRKIENTNYELYLASIDTTFCLVNKCNLIDNSRNIGNNMYIRIGGNFTAKHLPWYKENKIYSDYENYILNKKQTHISTNSSIIIKYIETKYNITKDFISITKDDFIKI